MSISTSLSFRYHLVCTVSLRGYALECFWGSFALSLCQWTRSRLYFPSPGPSFLFFHLTNQDGHLAHDQITMCTRWGSNPRGDTLHRVLSQTPWTTRPLVPRSMYSRSLLRRTLHSPWLVKYHTSPQRSGTEVNLFLRSDTAQLT